MNQILENPLFEAFANSSENIFIYVTDMKKNLTRWSLGAVNLFGIEEYQENTSEKWIEYVHPDDRQMYIDDISAVITGKKQRHDCQYRARRRNGEYVWVECRGSIILNDDGSPAVFAGIMTRIDNQTKYDNLTHLLTGYELTRFDFAGKGSLMLVGINDFRKINSRYGLIYGNKVLVCLAKQLVNSANESIVYRFQGDEFAILAKDKKPEYLIDIFKSVIGKCDKRRDEGEIVDIRLSAGIIEYDNEISCVNPLSNAELCLSYAKSEESNYIVYSEEIKNKQLRRDLVSEQLLNCLKDGYKGFRLVYQPIFTNEGDGVVACEALCRWEPNDERIGKCFPDEFISILENNGGIKELGYYVLNEAISQAGRWQKRFNRFNVSFNVSYRQLEDPDFVPAILKAIDDNNVDPSAITVELTESVFDVDTVMLRNSLKTLKDKGVMIALDDFGTGNSSFWMLHNIDVDIVKVDQTFIRGLDKNDKAMDYAITESVCLMCERIGCKTVAEGVENQKIWELIKKFGFTGLQGYLFSKPIEVSEFEQLLYKYN